jgi:hypothetical protein
MLDAIRRATILSAAVGSGRDCSNALKAFSIISKSILLSSLFFHGGTPYKAASVIGHTEHRTVPLSRLAQKLWQLGDCSPHSAAPGRE